MRIGLIGDVHAEDELLGVALRILTDGGAERLMCVGDLVDGPGSVERCCELLAAKNVETVRGNHDRWLITKWTPRADLPDATLVLGAEAHSFIAALPGEIRIPVDGGEILLCHGLGGDDMAAVELTAGSAEVRHNAPLARLIEQCAPRSRLWVLCGHTHRAGVWKHPAITVVNAGTLYREHAPCCTLVDLNRGEVIYFAVPGGARVRRETISKLGAPARSTRW